MLLVNFSEYPVRKGIQPQTTNFPVDINQEDIYSETDIPPLKTNELKQ